VVILHVGSGYFTCLGASTSWNPQELSRSVIGVFYKHGSCVMLLDPM
jgi:hypothetical protein